METLQCWRQWLLGEHVPILILSHFEPVPFEIRMNSNLLSATVRRFPYMFCKKLERIKKAWRTHRLLPVCALKTEEEGPLEPVPHTAHENMDTADMGKGTFRRAPERGIFFKDAPPQHGSGCSRIL